MTAKKDSNERVIKGPVLFKKVDPLAGYFELGRHEAFLGNRNFTVDRSVLPDDYEPEKYEVSGEYSIKLVVTPK